MPERLTDSQLDELEAMEQVVPPKPWRLTPPHAIDKWLSIDEPGIRVDYDDVDQEVAAAIALLVVESRNALPSLLAEARELRRIEALLIAWVKAKDAAGPLGYGVRGTAADGAEANVYAEALRCALGVPVAERVTMNEPGYDANGGEPVEE